MMSSPPQTWDGTVYAVRSGEFLRALLVAAMLLGCSPERERQPNPPRPTVRVVSLSPAASEVLLDLGAEGALIAVDSASHDLGGLGELPVVDLAASVDLAPDFVVVPTLMGGDQVIAERLREAGSDVVEFAPHDFDDAYRLCRTLGLRLGRVEEAQAFVRDHSRELALLSAASFGYQRPRVAAVVGVSPLEIAGGHSFTTDLIEIAGAESVTHGNDDLRVSMSPAELLAAAPDLVLVTSPAPMSEAERRQVRELLGDGPEVAYMAFDRQHFWLHDAVDTARQMRELVQPLVRGRLGPRPADVDPEPAGDVR